VLNQVPRTLTPLVDQSYSPTLSLLPSRPWVMSDLLPRQTGRLRLRGAQIEEARSTSMLHVTQGCYKAETEWGVYPSLIRSVARRA